MGDSGFLSSGDENHGEVLELHKWCQALLSNFEREFGIALEALQGKRASSRVEGIISLFFSSSGQKLGFLSSCDGDLRDLLVLPQ